MTDPRDTAPKNRSAERFGKADEDGFTHRSRMKPQGRRLHLDVSEAELEKRRAARTSPGPSKERGYARLYHDRVLQVDTGCDLGVLVGASGAPIPRESH